jgi:hypothetical protein
VGFEIYLQCFAGEPRGISRAAVRALFPIDEQSTQPDDWSVCYDRANSCRIRITPVHSNNGRITALCVYRPCGDIRFWDSILSILRMGPVMLYWPGGGPLIANQLAADALPQELVDWLGQARCVQSAQQIMEAIHAS